MSLVGGCHAFRNAHAGVNFNMTIVASAVAEGDDGAIIVLTMNLKSVSLTFTGKCFFPLLLPLPSLCGGDHGQGVHFAAVSPIVVDRKQTRETQETLPRYTEGSGNLNDFKILPSSSGWRARRGRSLFCTQSTEIWWELGASPMVGS